MEFYDLIVDDDFSESFFVTNNPITNKRVSELTPILIQCKKYIDENFEDPTFTIYVLNDYVLNLINDTDLSEEYIKRHFREAFGATMAEYLQHLRAQIPLKDINDYIDKLYHKKSISLNDVHTIKFSIVQRINKTIELMEADKIKPDKICHYLGISRLEYEALKHNTR